MFTGDVVNDDNTSGMGKFFKDCFNPSMIKFSIWNDRVEDDDDNKWNNDFIPLERDATKCYMQHKFKTLLEDSSGRFNCAEGTFEEVLNSEPTYCTIK